MFIKKSYGRCRYRCFHYNFLNYTTKSSTSVYKTNDIFSYNASKSYSIIPYISKNESTCQICTHSNLSEGLILRKVQIKNGVICEKLDKFSPLFSFITRKHSDFNFNQKWQREFSSSSFIKSVMEQVKKDLEVNNELRKAVEDYKKTSVAQNSKKFKSKMESTTETIKSSVAKLCDDGKEKYADLKEKFESVTNENEALKKVVSASEYISSKITSVVSSAIDKSQKIIENIDGNSSEKKAEEWRKKMAVKRYQKDASNFGVENNESCHKKVESTSGDFFNPNSDNQDCQVENSLIITRKSTWDRFDAHLKDMPFLRSFYENPVLGKLFGETELASSIRAMKVVDQNFRIHELIEYVEEVIAPHLVESFLIGDEKALKAQCGESAFAAMNVSIRERKKLNVTLDPSILLLRNTELRGAKRMDNPGELPWFIFTFSTQQINCLRDHKGEVIEGAIDDIREVVYSMAITKHPHPDNEGLYHPWMIKEMAIIGNTPCW